MSSARHVIDGPAQRSARAAGRPPGRHVGARKFALADWWRSTVSTERRAQPSQPATTVIATSGADSGAGHSAAYDTDREFSEMLELLVSRQQSPC